MVLAAAIGWICLMMTINQTGACLSLSDSAISGQTTLILINVMSVILIYVLLVEISTDQCADQTQSSLEALNKSSFPPEYFTPHLGEYVNVLSALEKLNVAILKAMDKTKEVGHVGFHLCHVLNFALL